MIGLLEIVLSWLLDFLIFLERKENGGPWSIQILIVFRNLDSKGFFLFSSFFYSFRFVQFNGLLEHFAFFLFLLPWPLFFVGWLHWVTWKGWIFWRKEKNWKTKDSDNRHAQISWEVFRIFRLSIDMSCWCLFKFKVIKTESDGFMIKRIQDIDLFAHSLAKCDYLGQDFEKIIHCTLGLSYSSRNG